MITRTRVLAAVTALAVLGAAGWLFEANGKLNRNLTGFADATPLIASTEVDLDALELLATTSCKCIRSGNSDEQCSVDFRSAKDDLEKQLYGSPALKLGDVAIMTACAPVSKEFDCFDFSDGEKCIVTGYSANGASAQDRDVMVCTKGEALAIEEASSAPFHPDGDFIGYDNQQAWDRANELSRQGIDEVMARIRNGEDFSAVERSRRGCV
jgi:hypothetical protein